jgi:hypothetical protein
VGCLLNPAASDTAGEPPHSTWHAEHLRSMPCRDKSTGLEFSPLGICFDIMDDMYVVDSEHSRIYRSGTGAGSLEVFSECGADYGECEFIDLAVNETGGIYVSERSSGSILALDRWGELGGSVYCGPGIAGIAGGRAGWVFAAMGLDGSIRMLDVETQGEGFESRIAVDGSDAYPVDCRLLADGDVAVTDAFSKQVVIMSPLGELKGALRGFEFASPFGVTCFEDRLILVSDSRLGLVAVFDSGGDFLFAFGQDVLDTPTFLDCRRDGLVCISDTGNMTIEVFRIGEVPQK